VGFLFILPETIELFLFCTFLHQVLVAQLFLQPQIAANKQQGLSTSIIKMVTDVWLTDARALNVG